MKGVNDVLSTLLSMFSVLIKKTLLFVSYVKNQAFPQPLEAEEEAKYIAQMKAGDNNARNKLIEHNLRLVAHIVKKLDRKSTRLNSSHVAISYAVFCLKKKSIKEEINSALLDYAFSA